jgi:cytidine deaminase
MKHINHQISIQLLQRAKTIADKAYAPYSNFFVGAAVLTSSGNIYEGCNVENASYGLTLCAERNALSSMIVAGNKKFEAIAVVAKKNTDEGLKEVSGCFPCGACRQWLYEFGPDAVVITEDKQNQPVFTAVRDLLPEAFGPEALE